MAKVRLGDIATVVTKGTTPTTMGFQFEDGGINFVKIESISEDGTFLKEKFSHISDECNVQMRRSQLQENDILFSIAGAIGRSAIVTKEILPANTNQALAIIRVPKGKIDYNYLLYALSSSAINQQATQHQQGVAQLNISLKNVSDFLLPIYTEAMQKQIVHNLKKIDKLISLRKQQLAKLDELVKAQFANTFENDANFHTDYMENLSEFVTVGIANSATHAYAEHGVVMLRNQNIKENHLDDTELVYIEPKFADKYKSKKLEANDILVTRTGYPGIACVVPQKYAGSQTFTTLIIRLKKGTNVSSCYICHYINSSHGKKYVSGTKVGVAQQNFGAKVLAKMPVIVPPIELQNQFATFVERVDKQKQTVQQSLEKLELMKKALMQEYFG